MSKRLVRTAFLTLGLTLVTNTSNQSWGEQQPCRIEREACEEAAANTKPMPSGCAYQGLEKPPEVCENRQGQQSCRIERAQYLCTEPNGHKSLSTRLKYFPLGAEGQQGDGFSSGPESETPAQAEPVPSDRPLLDKLLFPDAGASPSKLAKLLPPELRYSPPDRLATGNMWPVTSMTLRDGTKVLTSSPAKGGKIWQLYKIEYKKDGKFYMAYDYLLTGKKTGKGGRDAPTHRPKRR